MSIIHTPTEEERKKATDEMVDNAIKNAKKFADNKREGEGKEEGQISLIIFMYMIECRLMKILNGIFLY